MLEKVMHDELSELVLQLYDDVLKTLCLDTKRNLQWMLHRSCLQVADHVAGVHDSSKEVVDIRRLRVRFGMHCDVVRRRILETLGVSLELQDLLAHSCKKIDI
jgi:hypothetical protein